MKLSFDQVMRLLVCVVGIVFFGIGIWMIKSGISAQGVIDIQMRQIMTGHLETGSAGLFITFFSFWMIMLSFLIGRRAADAKPKTTQSLPSRMPVMLTITVIVWALTACFFLSAYYSSSQNASVGFGFLTVLFFFISVGISIGTFDTWDKEIEEKRNASK